MRTTTSSVTFKRPFMLPGFDKPHAPGTFEVNTDEERLDTVFEAWRRVATVILLTEHGSVSAWAIDPQDLYDAVILDSADKLRPL